MKKLTIIKIGGQVLDNEAKLKAALLDFSKIKTPKILVHGGGKKASELCQTLGIEPKMWEGRRITDEATLQVVTMVYAGLLSKKLVSQLQALNCNAIGLSGADGNLIEAEKREVKQVDFGYAGDLKKVNKKLIINLLDDGFTPTICAITHDRKGQLLNTNADTIAAGLAAALAKEFEVTLKFCFEKAGVLFDPQDDTSIIQKLDKINYTNYRNNGVIANGMLPKLDNAFSAKKHGVKEVYVCDLLGIKNKTGTEICA